MILHKTRRLLLLVATALVIGGCGNDKEAGAGIKGVAQLVKQAIAPRGQQAAQAPAITREALGAYKTPMIMAELPAIGLTTFLVPFGQNVDVQTWSTVDDKTISFRQGVMVATRGFGPDLMQAVVPSAAQLARGVGSHRRVHYYLDGADHIRQHDFDCTLSRSGAETVTVVGIEYATDHVTETCSRGGQDFANEYWFEKGGFLRKSKQMLVPEWGAIQFQRLIDDGGN